MANGEVFEARYSPVRSVLMGLGALGFVAIGLWMIGAFGDIPCDGRLIPAEAIPYIGWMGILFFGPLATLHFARASVPGTAVRVDANGMMMAGCGEEVIPWDDFTSLSSRDIMGTQYLLLDVVDQRFATFSLFKKFLWKINEPFIGQSGWLVINNTNRKHNELVEAICHFAPPNLTRWLR